MSAGYGFRPKHFKAAGTGKFRLRRLTVRLNTKFDNLPLKARFVRDDSLAENCCYVINSARQAQPLPMPKKSARPEGFCIAANPSGLAISAADRRGLRYCLQFLADCRKANIDLAEGFYEDYPALKIRGVMVDVARVSESIETLEELTKFISDCRANTLMLYLENKFPLKNHPSLATPDGYTLSQIKSLQSLAQSLDIDLVPSFSLFGHATYILRHSAYRKLSDGPQIYQLNPLLPETQKLCVDHFDSWNDAVDSPMVHVGCDETPYMGLCKQTERFIAKHGKAEFFARHVRFLHKSLARNNQRMMIWGDMLRHYPEIAERIPKDIIICDWNYGKINPQFTEGIAKLRRQGFDVICVPAAARSAEMFIPDAVHHNGNIAPFVKAAVKNGAMGCMVSSWESYTIFPKWIWPGYAMGLELAWTGKTSAAKIQAARQRAYSSVFGENFQTAIDAVNTVGGGVMIKHMRKNLFTPGKKNKTYHLVTHEVLPTDPILYGTANKTTKHRQLEHAMRDDSIALSEEIKGNTKSAKFLRDSLLWTRLVAEIRLLPQSFVASLREALGAYTQSDLSCCIKSLQTAGESCDQLKKMSSSAMAGSRRWWDCFRLPDDPLQDRFHAIRRHWAVEALKNWQGILTRSIADVANDKTPRVFEYWDSKRVILCRLGLNADEVNILCMDVDRRGPRGGWQHECHIEAFQIPASDYCYTFMPIGPVSELRLTITRTQTPWDFNSLAVEVYALPKLRKKPRCDFVCEDYRLGEKIYTVNPTEISETGCVIKFPEPF